MKTGSLNKDKSINNASSTCLGLFYQSLKGQYSAVPPLHTVATSETNVAPICVYMLL